MFTGISLFAVRSQDTPKKALRSYSKTVSSSCELLHRLYFGGNVYSLVTFIVSVVAGGGILSVLYMIKNKILPPLLTKALDFYRNVCKVVSILFKSLYTVVFQ